MKRSMILLWLSMAAIAAGAQDVSLDGEWKFRLPDDSVTAKMPETLKAERTVVVPHTYNLMDGLEDYAGAAVYKRVLPVTDDMRGKTVRVHFTAVHHDAVVFVNGQKVGEHLGKGYTPFSFDVTRYIDFGRDNVLEVHCSNAYTKHALPYERSFDWSNDGGIYRSVKMHVSGRHTIRYVHVTPQVNLADSTGVANFDVRLFDGKANRVTVNLSVLNRQTGEKVYEATQTLTKKKGENSFKTKVDMGKVMLWHFDTPNLYDFSLTVMDGKQVSDEKTDHFGFRSFGIENRQFCLNGENVRLPGIENMPGSNPRYGMAETLSFMDSTVRVMKNINCCITRFHWVQDEKMLTLMDEMGILAQEELPWWQKPYKELTPELRQVARETIEEMIEAHYNHPCLFAWGLSNEVGGNHEEIRRLAEVARSMDSTRMLDVLCNKTYANLEKDPSFVLDIPTWNEYTGTWHGKKREELPERFNLLDKALGDRPLFITEGGLCEPTFPGGDARRVDDLIYHVGWWQRTPFVCGFIYFCLQDYRTQMGEEGLGKWRIRRHGVTKVDLTPKSSYNVLRQMSSPIDITKVGPARGTKKQNSLAGQYEVDCLDRGASIVLSVKKSVPTYILRGYELRYTDGDGREQKILLPDMIPGESYPMVIENMNDRFAFEIFRPNGFSVIAY
ncbi:MAG: hypothetical protein K2O17_06065 [Bacteroidaceae bacterium]|nr:hypothetical protein [Bacteroidaceae bacterium]